MSTQTSPSGPAPVAAPDAGRRRHFAGFYGLDDPEAAGVPLGVVFGNCQAESLRQVLPATVNWVRMPPVHELTSDDLPYLDRLLDRTQVLVSQPVRDDYHGLPLGTGQLFSRVRSQAVTAVMPVIRFAGLYPTQVIVRPPSDPSLSPPVVPYHDLRTMAEAVGNPISEPTVASVRALAALSQHELRGREQRHDAVPISDIFDEPAFDLMRTINHPGNPVWTELAERMADRLGLAGDPADVGRELLDSIHAPRSATVIDAWALDETPTTNWTIGGNVVDDDHRHRAQLDWYAANPDALAAGLRRHEKALGLLAFR